MKLVKKKAPKRKANTRRKVDEVHYENIFDKNINIRERIVYFNQDVDDSGLELINKALDEFDVGEAPKPFKIVVSSYGGTLYDAFGIIDRIKDSKCHIMTYGSGKIMSAATLILAAGDERVIGNNAWFMMHQSRGSMEDGTTFDNAELEMKHWKELENQMYWAYEKLSGNTTKANTFKKLCKKDYFMRAEDVLKLGLVDRIQGLR